MQNPQRAEMEARYAKLQDKATSERDKGSRLEDKLSSMREVSSW
jgi:hypothetical protein